MSERSQRELLADIEETLSGTDGDTLIGIPANDLCALLDMARAAVSQSNDRPLNCCGSTEGHLPTCETVQPDIAARPAPENYIKSVEVTHLIQRDGSAVISDVTDRVEFHELKRQPNE